MSQRTSVVVLAASGTYMQCGSFRIIRIV